MSMPSSLHRFLEGDAVLAALDGVTWTPMTLHAVLLQHAGLGQLRGEVQAGLAAEVGQQRVGPLLLDDLGHALGTFSGSM